MVVKMYSNAVNQIVYNACCLSSVCPPSLFIWFLSSSPRPIQLLKPSCVARSVGPAPHCFSSLSTSSRPACRLCRTACSQGESAHTHTRKTLQCNISPFACWSEWFSHFQYGQSGNGDRSFERGEDREAAGAVERNVTGQDAFFYPSPTGP